MLIPKMQFVFGGRIYFPSHKNNVLDTRKIVTDKRCCHNVSRDMSQDRRHSFDLSVNK